MIQTSLLESEQVEEIKAKTQQLMITALMCNVISDEDMERYIADTTEPVYRHNLYHLCSMNHISGVPFLESIATMIECYLYEMNTVNLQDNFAFLLYGNVRNYPYRTDEEQKALCRVLLNYITDGNHLAALGSLALISVKSTTDYLSKLILSYANDLEKVGGD